jgi:hypothetical protein
VMNFHVQSGITFKGCLIPVIYSLVMLGIVFLVVEKKDL